MFDKSSVLTLYSDDATLTGSMKPLKQNKKQTVTVTIPTNGGIVIVG
jgi:20S proteasome alpha/beta subunit